MAMAALLQTIGGRTAPDPVITALGPDDAHLLSFLAEEVARVLPLLGAQASEIVATEMRKRPDRWSTALRLVVGGAGKHGVLAASRLAEIGDADDAVFLRAAGAGTGGKSLRAAAALITRRLAPGATVHDLGVVSLQLAGRPLIAPVRRKVLGLLCYLATRQNQAATRDETLEALWPDLGPDAGGNSLHQTIYYLRRNFDPDFTEGISAPYVLFDGEVVTLNSELVSFDSKATWSQIAASSPGDIEAADRLMARYAGRFALDFTYEDWASSYRETLHAAVLDRVEAGIEAAIASSRWDIAVALGHRLLAIDPAADAVELALLRAYKRSGRMAAAAEQYAHYAATLRIDLGVDPPDFGSI
jgi:DNA-binding SARP family transcriptional activator